MYVIMYNYHVLIHEKLLSWQTEKSLDQKEVKLHKSYKYYETNYDD